MFEKCSCQEHFEFGLCSLGLYLVHGNRNGIEKPRAFVRPLVDVERFVRALDKFLLGFMNLIVRPAAGEGGAKTCALHLYFESTDAIQHAMNFFGAALGKNGHEFIATEADGEVRAANRALETVREALDNGIAGGMAVGVVDFL